MKILVCGGRDYADARAVYLALSLARSRYGNLTIIQGGARGADRFAREWAAQNFVKLINEEADWKAFGKRAGAIRNQAMLDKYKPDLVLAFPGSYGTRDMIQRAEAAGVPIQRIS